MNHSIIPKVVRELLPAAITDSLFAPFNRVGADFGLAGFPLRGAPTLSDAALRLGAGWSLVGGVICGVPSNLRAPGRRGKEGVA